MIYPNRSLEAIAQYGFFIYGDGGHGKVVRDIVYDSPIQGTVLFGFVSDDPKNPNTILPIQIPKRAKVIIALGDNKTRESAHLKLKKMEKDLIFPTVSHPFSYKALTANIKEGNVICAGSVIGADASIGSFCIINTGATIDHDCEIGNFVHIAPGVNLCGYVRVGDRTLVGVGSSVRPEVRIGLDCIIGAGSVVVSDIPDRSVAYGNPARIVDSELAVETFYKKTGERIRL